jgi:autotransporter-associated beta strand protein
MHHHSPSCRLFRRNVLTTAIAALIAQAMLTGELGAQFQITGFTGATAQNFDTLPITGSANTWANDSTLDGWYLFNRNSADINAIAASDGTSTAGSFYSFGAESGTDRSLGGLASGGAYFGSPASGTLAGYIAFGATNSSVGTINAFTLGFDGEQWRNANTSAQTMVLEYGFGATVTSVATWLSGGSTFDWTSPVIGGTAGAVNGNVAGLAAARGGTISGLTWTPGDTLWIRWLENNDAGNDHGLAIDNFSLSWTGTEGGGGGTPNFWDLNGATAGVGGFGPATWDAATTNWTSTAVGTAAPKAFDANQATTFAGTPGTVNIAGAGVSPQKAINFDVDGYLIQGSGPLTLGTQAAINVTNAGETATISAPITGTSGLIKAGGGTLVLSGTNTHSGSTTVNGGVLQIVDAVQLGTSSLVLGGGSVRSTGPVALATGAALSGSGTLEIGGTGVVTVPGTTSLTSLTFVNPTTLNMNGAGNTFGGLTMQSASGPVTLNGDFSVGTTNRTWNVANADAPEDLIVNGKITGTGRITIAGDAMAVVRLNGDSSTFGVGFTLNSTSPSLVLGNGNALGSGTLFFNGSTVVLASALTIPTNFSIGGSVGVTGAEATITGNVTFFGTTPKTLTFPGVVNIVGQLGTTASSTSGGITIVGGGTVNLLNAANEHKDITYVQDGTLNLNGSLAGAISVGDFSGLTDGDLGISPGTISTANIGGLGLFEKSTLRLELNSTLGTADSIVVSPTGEFILGAGVAALQIVDLGSGTLPIGKAFTLIDAGLPIGADQFFKSLPDLAIFTNGNNKFSIDYNAGADGADIVLTAVPEPTAALVLTISGALLASRRRRRGSIVSRTTTITD